MNKLVYIALLLLPTIVFSQARLVLNDNGYINIENQAFLVIDNGASNAITVTGTGGNILSENERDVIKWNVGANTGNHIIPWTNVSNVKIPVEVNITTAGNATGSLILSTYRTNNTNLPWPSVPSPVTHMYSPDIPGDASLFCVDRFYRIDNNSYGTKPAATLSFGYDFPNEGTGANTINEANLQAQRFNPGVGWESLLFGVVNTGTKKVNSAVVTASNFHKDWVLIDKTVPLNITLLGFDANCNDGRTVLNWSTASETDNAHFIIEKCVDAVNFFEITTINGGGTTNTVSNYSYTDETANSETVYYRIKQVDMDGNYQYFNTISSTNCTKDNEFGANHFVFDDNSLHFNIVTSTKEDVEIALYDYRGSLISSKKVNVTKGVNTITLDNIRVSSGMYLLNISGENKLFNTKIVK